MPIDLMREIAVRWGEPDPRHVPLLREGGITAVVAAPHEGFEAACREAGLRAIHEDQIRSLRLQELGDARQGETVVIRSGLWPGTGNPDPGVASATRSLWIDQNAYLVGYLRALYPAVQPVLGYLPDAEAGVSPDRAFRFDSLELALTEAWMAGGDYLLALEPRYREALLKGTPDALAVWRRLGRTAQWLSANAGLFRKPAFSEVTVLVDHGDSSREIANLCYRQNVSPALGPAANPPAPGDTRRLVISAAGIDSPSGAARGRILAHAQGGATVVVDQPDAWWRTSGLKPLRSEPDRDFFTLGRGQVVAYKEPVTDPGEFALDLIDIVGQKRRAARLWNSRAGLALATTAPRSGATVGKAALHLINYAQPMNQPLLAQLQGVYSRATLLHPGAAPSQLRIARRGTLSEVAIPQLQRAASVIFS